jgi:tape measure domain-containing protein
MLFDEKSLGRISGQLKRAGAQFQRIGSDLTLSLTAPLGALGIGAIKAAGDIESLTLALKSNLGSAEAAEKELAALTIAARNPGLGLEQAVRGSVRLQNVGFSAEQARDTLIELANAVAAGGGAAVELDSVTRQLSQITSKGRILQEDISVISENMPGLAGLMQKAFGTQSVDAIRAMGIGGKEFVVAITEAAKELPRVESGIKNNIANVMDELKQSSAKFGLAINKAFDISGTIGKLSDFVLRLATGFENLNPVVQKTILAIAGAAIAIGPLLKAYGSLLQVGGLVVSGFKSLVVGLGNVTAAAGRAVVAFRAMDAAMKATVIFAIIGAVALLAAAYSDYAGKLSVAEQAQASVTSVQQSALASISQEKVKVETLVGAINDNTRSLTEKKAALEELKKISPEYFGQLTIEKDKIVGLTAAMGEYIKSLEKAAIVKQATEEIARLSTSLTDLSEASDPTALQYATNALKTLALGPLAIAAGGFQNLNEQTREFNKADLQNATEAKIVALRKLISENITLSEKTAVATTATKDLGEQSKTFASILKDVAAEVEKAKFFGEDVEAAKVDALRKGIERLIDEGVKPASKEIQYLKREIDALAQAKVPEDIIAPKTGSAISLGSLALPDPSKLIKDTPFADPTAYENMLDIFERLSAGVTSFGDAWKSAFEIVQESGELGNTVLFTMSDAIAQAAASGADSFAKLGEAALASGAKVVRAWIQQGVAAAVAKALSSLPFPANIAAGAIAGGLAAAAFTKAIGKIGIKGFARGTKNAPGGMALVGEQGPELINLPRGSQVFPTPQTNQMLNNMGGGDTVLGGEFMVRGTDLVLVLERAQKRNERFR